MKHSTRGKKQNRLTLGGRLTVERAAEFKALLIAALNDSPSIHLRLEGVEEIDLSFLQLLMGARRSCEALGGSLLLAGPTPQPYRQAVEQAGLQRHPDAEGTDPLPAFQTEA